MSVLSPNMLHAFASYPAAHSSMSDPLMPSLSSLPSASVSASLSFSSLSISDSSSLPPAGRANRVLGVCCGC